MRSEDSRGPSHGASGRLRSASDGDRLLDAEHGVLAASLGVHEGGGHVLEAGYLMSATLDLYRVEDAIKRLAVTAGPLKG